MKKTHIIYLALGILSVHIILGCILLRETGFSGHPENDPPFPKSDSWVCAELGITLNLDEGSCFVVIGDDAIQCSYARERGAYEVFVRCYEFDNLDYDFAHLFFSGNFLSMGDDAFYMEEHKSGIVYTFHKVVD